jgi:DNA-binding MarR family transcriptional regulator
VHLSAQGQLRDDEVATPGFTQGGMASALGVRQNSLTNVLRRLVAAGLLTEDVRHVKGRNRRLKVYRLTVRGEGLARELRLRRKTSP